MADRDTDKPENKGLKGAWNKRPRVGRTAQVFGQEFKYILGKDRLDSAAFVTPIVMTALFGAPVLLLHDTTTTRDYAPDTGLTYAVTAGAAVAESGYVAITTDDGKTGHMLVSDEGRYRLYSFTTDANSGERAMTYVSDQDDAWHIISQYEGQLFQSLRSTVDPEVVVPQNNIETMRFESISGLIVEGDEIRRYAQGGVDADGDYPTMRARLEVQSAWWMAASQAVFNGQYGFADGEIEAKKGSFIETTERDFGLPIVLGSLMAGMSGLGLAGVSVNAAARTRRRMKHS